MFGNIFIDIVYLCNTSHFVYLGKKYRVVHQIISLHCMLMCGMCINSMSLAHNVLVLHTFAYYLALNILIKFKRSTAV